MIPQQHNLIISHDSNTLKSKSVFMSYSLALVFATLFNVHNHIPHTIFLIYMYLSNQQSPALQWQKQSSCANWHLHSARPDPIETSHELSVFSTGWKHFRTSTDMTTVRYRREIEIRRLVCEVNQASNRARTEVARA